jgi:hypothetical protein
MMRMPKGIKKILAALVPASWLLAAILSTPQSASCLRGPEPPQQSPKSPDDIPSSPVKLKPFPTEPIAHFRLFAPSRRVFETLARMADLKVNFSDDFQPSPLSIDLENVKVEDAINAAATKAHVFWIPIASDTILVIPDSPANRKKYEKAIPKSDEK